MSFAVFLAAQHEVIFRLFPCQFSRFLFLITCGTVVEDYPVISLRELERKDIIRTLCLDSCNSRSALRTIHLNARPRLVRVCLFTYLTQNIRVYFLPSDFVDCVDDRGRLLTQYQFQVIGNISIGSLCQSLVLYERLNRAFYIRSYSLIECFCHKIYSQNLCQHSNHTLLHRCGKFFAFLRMVSLAGLRIEKIQINRGFTHIFLCNRHLFIFGRRQKTFYHRRRR